MANGLRKLAAADSPVGKVLWGEKRPNGLRIEKVAVPIGVIAVISSRGRMSRRMPRAFASRRATASYSEAARKQ